MAERKQLKIIWGMAKNLAMTKEDVYALLYQQTGKEHMSECTEQELSRTVQAMILLKERRTNRPGMITGRQRYKVHQLERALGWEKEPKRLKAFIRKYYQVDSLDWLSEADATRLIEGMKQMAKRAEQAEQEESQKAVTV